MPRYHNSDIAHTASTDHRIVRRPVQRPLQPGDPENTPLLDFYRDRFPDGDPQSERNRGLGLVKMMISGRLAPQRHGERAVRLLEAALARYPQDVEVRAGKALALMLLQRQDEALPEARWALARRPGDWRLLAAVAVAARAEGQTEQGISSWREVVAINPVVAEYQLALVSLLLQSGQLDEARARCRKLLELDPFNVGGRQAWVGFLLREGKKAEAAKEFDVIRRLNPPDLVKREEWFAEKMR
jgi:tetratricopeptide (TPR) repeat protein